MAECKLSSTPMENRLNLFIKGEEKLRTKQSYRELIGCLMYASLTTRPDLTASVNFFSQFQSCPTDEHWTHLKRILRYVKDSMDAKLVYYRNGGKVLEIYTDADWANNVVDRRSVSGSVFKVFGSTVAWITRKQHTVALSSTEAELTALCVVVCHGLWMQRLLRDLDCKTDAPVTYYEDNQSTIRIAEDSKDFGRLNMSM
ncbi:uncharacterized protein LOC129728772 [Wyeomyia smithii]|uniref:uncharacterized protein LOC129728772 n=1 Tax=Wyeomyia smithii TaxID=174621 RepID=UPI002467E4EF|nr:uncharacterized protein LOC129728772 [Wyeomyia smithii]